MTNLLLFLGSGIAAVIGLVFALGLAWLAVAIPVLISAAATYGLFSLRRRGARGARKRTDERSRSAHRMGV
jgi:membrane protein implicated in regulation of membrane protease activity